MVQEDSYQGIFVKKSHPVFIAHFSHKRGDSDAQHISQKADDHDKGEGHFQFNQLIAGIKGRSTIE
jgi:hypothetical protein